ncbi:MAG: hypothetical protein EXR86_00130 [Gammaproteobacteria bacterium]|nr:hypothetical protein [Gammaproteobacteria bacterium]
MLDLVGVETRCAANSVVVRVHHHVIALAEIRDCGAILGAISARQQLALAIDRDSGRGVFTDVDIRGRADVWDHIVVVVVPGHDEAAGGERRHVWLVLTADGRLVDQELAAELGTRRGEALPDYRLTAVVAGIITIRRPYHHERAVRQHRDVRHVLAIVRNTLVSHRGGVDQEGVAKGPTRRVEDPAIHAVARAVVTALVGPYDDEIAVRERRYIRGVLVAGLGVYRAENIANPGLDRDHGPRVVVTLQVDVVAATVRIRV